MLIFVEYDITLFGFAWTVTHVSKISRPRRKQSCVLKYQDPEESRVVF
jgi:hypothetical protein